MTAVFFLMADLVGRHRERGDDRFNVIAPMGHRTLLGAIFFAAISMASLPPFSGFISKVWILQSSSGQPQGFWLWGVLLSASLMTLAAVSRAGSGWFWRSGAMPSPRPIDRACVLLVSLMIVLNLGLAVLAEPVMHYLELTAEQLLSPQAYLRAALPEEGRLGMEALP